MADRATSKKKGKKAPLKKNFFDALAKNFYMKESKKEFLITHFDVLPEKILKQLFKYIKAQNDIAEKYISIALKNDPSLVQDMQSTVKKMKKEINGLKESEEKNELEEALEEQLKQL